ncbi:hypothetical protein [Microbacterium allomyrinae]|uniref:Uncharacterized protein n=1 Tax=Microbacterium allomyrinae TaxID=2830666 RepID=A0A9X1LS88_9MICO|nr:hypothetical protein [Microbacterium allomyrinae]MCC2030605.1 hypothetical protein [Microbacterium allomyrinae]
MTEYQVIAQLRGKQGIQGPIGLPGVNAVPGDAAVGGWLGTSGSAAQTGARAQAVATAVRDGFADGIAGLPGLRKVRSKIAEAKPNSRPTIRVYSIGSSVGLAGGVTNPATEAPLPLFIAAMKAALDPMGTCDWTSANLCIDGSVANQWLAPLKAHVGTNGAPDVLLHIPGMNDFQGAAWHKGQSYDVAPPVYGFLAESRRLFDYCNSLRALVVTATTPHPHPGRIPNSGGLAVADRVSGIIYPATNVYQWPGYPATETPTITLPTGQTVQTLARFNQGNDGIRAVAAEKGAICVDAGMLFLIAAATAPTGYDALYSGAEYVHPNTAAIDASYGAGYRSLARAFRNARLQSGEPGVLRGQLVLASGASGVISIPEGTRGELTVYGTAGGGYQSVRRCLVVSDVDSVGVADMANAKANAAQNQLITGFTTTGASLDVSVTTFASGSTSVLDWEYRY